VRQEAQAAAEQAAIHLRRGLSLCRAGCRALKAFDKRQLRRLACFDYALPLNGKAVVCHRGNRHGLLMPPTEVTDVYSGGTAKSTMRVGIVGAGIGGLSLALALRERGLQADVFEQAAELTEIGAAIALSANGLREYARLVRQPPIAS
jgi:hypothetical protein